MVKKIPTVSFIKGNKTLNALSIDMIPPHPPFISENAQLL